MGRYNRIDILHEGISLMRQTGYHRTGIQDILKACNIPKGSFYNFFESKENFTIEAIRLYARQLMEIIDTIEREPITTPMEKIEKFFRTIQRFYNKNEFKYSCLLGNLATELSAENENFAKEIRRQMRAIKERMLKIIREGQEQKLLIGSWDTEQINHFIFDSFFGALTRMKYEKNNDSIELFFKLNLQLIQSIKSVDLGLVVGVE